MTTGPSPHLTWKELACKDGTIYPDEFIVDNRVYALSNVFEAIRDMYGKPIEILSAYRTPSHNRKIGGARNSQHVLGRALDLKPPKGVTLERFYDDIRDNAAKLGLGGIGKYKTFVHVDIRQSPKLAVWFGTGIKDSRTR